MNKKSGMKWEISEAWGVGADQHCWILYRKHRNTWRGVKFFSTPAQLLEELYQILSREYDTQANVVRQAAIAKRLTVACGKRLKRQIEAELGPIKDMAPSQAVVALRGRKE